LGENKKLLEDFLKGMKNLSQTILSHILIEKLSLYFSHKITMHGLFINGIGGAGKTYVFL
jgi:hypothetical protein